MFNDDVKQMKMKHRYSFRRLNCFILLLAIIFSLAGCGGSRTGTDKTDASDTGHDTVELTVFAAASLTEALTAIGDKYMSENNNVKLNFNFDSSGKLLTQIQEGAECDIFISAAPEQMDALDGTLKGDAEKNPDGLDMLAENSRTDLLENKVVLAAADDNEGAADSFGQLTDLLRNGDIMLAVGNSEVPVGMYTQRIFDYLGIDEEAVSDKLTYGSNVKEVTAAVSEGAADCGIIYASDAYSAGLTPVDEATEEMCGKVIYPASVLNTSLNGDAASDFLSYLKTGAASAEFSKVLFTPIS